MKYSNSSGWTYYSHTFTTDDFDNAAVIYLFTSVPASSGNVYFDDVILEKGVNRNVDMQGKYKNVGESVVFFGWIRASTPKHREKYTITQMLSV